MAGNTFGQCFTVTTFGESHGRAIGCIVDGCPPGLELSEALIQPYLDRRKPGTSKFTSQRRELDQVKLLSGVFEGQTTGTPIALVIENRDIRSRDYDDIKHTFRPGHADYTYYKKYGVRDYRGGGRASARETATRVAAGAIAQIYLQKTLGVQIFGWLEQMGSTVLKFEDEQAILRNPFFCPNDHQVGMLEQTIETLRREGDSIGARIAVIAKGVPVGLGEPVFDKLDASLAYAMMSINAVKAVEIGAGFDAVYQKGSEHRDEMDNQGFLSNHAGGILGGIATGQDIKVSLALKPTSSITKPGRSIQEDYTEVEVVTKGRHDPCVGLRAVPVAEAMMALTLMDHYLRNKAQNRGIN